MISGQLGLLGREAPEFDCEIRNARRVSLGSGAWIDHAPGWLSGHEAVFEALLETTRWRSERREMYDRVVDVPRLYAVLPADGPGHPILDGMRRALSQRYAVAFERTSLGLYRDGKDSVAWHGDYVARELDSATVATVSVGAPRRFLVRPTGGGSSLPFSLGWGDLIVMGGTCQRTYQHSIPKVSSAAPRIAIMFRPDWSEQPPREGASALDAATR